MNLVDGGCSGSGCCSKGLCLSSLFGFNSDCCCSPSFVDDGLEPDHRHRNLIKRNGQYATGRVKPKQHYVTLVEKEQPTKIRKLHRGQSKANERGTVLAKPSDSRKDVDSVEPFELFEMKESAHQMDESETNTDPSSAENDRTNGRWPTVDLSKTVDPANAVLLAFGSFRPIAGIGTPATTDEPPYLLIDRSGKDQQKLSLFNADDYIKQLQLNRMRQQNAATLTMLDEDERTTSNDEFFLEMDESQKLMKFG